MHVRAGRARFSTPAGRSPTRAWLDDPFVEIVVQVSGKVRGKVAARKGLSASEIRELALGDPAIRKWVEGREIKKVVWVENKLLNLVV